MSVNILKKYNLPSNFNVKVKRTESGGYYAYLPDYSGCITFAPDFIGLIANVNDAILTYFEVSREDALKFEGGFIPTPIRPRVVKEERSINFKPMTPNLKYQFAGT